MKFIFTLLIGILSSLCFSQEPVKDLRLIAKKKGKLYGLVFSSSDTSSFKVTKGKLRLNIDSLPSLNLYKPDEPILISIECSDDDFLLSDGYDTTIYYQNLNPFLNSGEPFYYVEINDNCFPAWFPSIWWPSYQVLSKDTFVIIHRPAPQVGAPANLDKQLEAINEILQAGQNLSKNQLADLLNGLGDIERAVSGSEKTFNLSLPDSLIERIIKKQQDSEQVSREIVFVPLTIQESDVDNQNPLFLMISGVIFVLLVLIIGILLNKKESYGCCCPDKKNPDEEKDIDWFEKIKSLVPEDRTFVEISFKDGNEELDKEKGTLSKTKSKLFIGLQTSKGLILIKEERVITIKEVKEITLTDDKLNEQTEP